MRIFLKYLIFALATLPTNLFGQSMEIRCSDQLQSLINLGTGLSQAGTLLEPGSGVVDPYWTLSNRPALSNCTDAESASLSSRAYLVNFNDANETSWVNQEGVRAISPVDAGLEGRLSCQNAPDDPFVFERYFCLNADAEIQLDVSFKGDDRLQLELVDLRASRVLAASEPYSYQNPPPAPARFRVRLGVNSGIYALRAKLGNDAIASGFSIAGQVEMLSPGSPAQLSNATLIQDFACQRLDTLTLDDYYYYPDSALSICIDPEALPLGGPYQYQWYNPEGQLIIPNGNGECYTIPALNPKTTGIYYCHIQPTDSDVCYVLPVKVETYVQDPTGAWYIPNQLVVKYRNNTTEAEKLAYIESLQADRLDSCMCLIDLLMLPDTLYDANGNPIIDPEEKKKKAGSEDNAGVETVGWNTVMEEETIARKSVLPNREKPGRSRFMPAVSEVATTNGDSVIIALIDTGFDFTHPDVQGYLWQNPEPEPMSTDSCKVCITGAKRGYDFGDQDSDPSPVNPHGDFVGQAIIYAAESLAGSLAPKIQIMPLKVMDRKETITVFNVTCATIFAVRHGAQIINYSMGGYGGYQDILAAALNTVAPGNCVPTVVTSAGNDSLDISIVPHYFSNLRDSLSTVLTINSINPIDSGLSLAPYSNFGPNVDLATSGAALFDTSPYANVKGTSISAGYISGILAYIYEQKPGISSATALSALQNLTAQVGPQLPLDDPDGLFWKPVLDRILEALPTETCTYTMQACIPLVTNTKERNRAREWLEVKVLPNPNTGELSFAFDLQESQDLRITIFDAQGRLIDQMKLKRGEGLHLLPYSLKNRPDGIYYYQVSSAKYIYAGKIIKQRGR